MKAADMLVDILDPDGRDLQTLSGLKHEVNRLLQEQEQKSNLVVGSSKADLQQLDSIREFYAVA